MRIVTWAKSTNTTPGSVPVVCLFTIQYETWDGKYHKLSVNLQLGLCNNSKTDLETISTSINLIAAVAALYRQEKSMPNDSSGEILAKWRAEESSGIAEE